MPHTWHSPSFEIHESTTKISLVPSPSSLSTMVLSITIPLDIVNEILVYVCNDMLALKH